MNVRSSVAHQTPLLRLAGSLCLHLFGTAVCLVGLFILARDGFFWFNQGGRVDLAITTLAGILPSLPYVSAPPPWNQLLQGSGEFCGVTPLSLLLLMLGWCARTQAQVGWEMAQASARADAD